MENLETEFLHLHDLDIRHKWFCRSLDQFKSCPQKLDVYVRWRGLKYLPTVYYTQKAIPYRSRVKYSVHSFKTFREKKKRLFLLIQISD